jgi:RNA polymerase sigma factor (sigma-70 family)
MSASTLDMSVARDAFDRLLVQLRPKLHRYCARMTGSRLDGEDLMQETLFEAYTKIETLDDASRLKPWLFRIAHNRCIDFLRRRDARERAESAYSDDIGVVAAEPATTDAHRAIERLVGHLPPKERACVLLKDVFDYSLEETAELVDSTVGGVKSALSRGRAKLADLPDEPAGEPRRPLDPDTARLLQRYVDLFNRHDWDGVRGSPAPMLGCGSPTASTACSETLPISPNTSGTQKRGPWSSGRSTESLSCSCSFSETTSGRSRGRFVSMSPAASSTASKTIMPARGSLETPPE